MPFEEWLLTNNEPWTVPYDLNGERDFWPVLSRRNPAPENRMSQFTYLRPDLGTETYKFEDLPKHMEMLGLNCDHRSNATTESTVRRETIPVSDAVEAHIARYCEWDLKQGCKFQ